MTSFVAPSVKRQTVQLFRDAYLGCLEKRVRKRTRLQTYSTKRCRSKDMEDDQEQPRSIKTMDARQTIGFQEVPHEIAEST